MLGAWPEMLSVALALATARSWLSLKAARDQGDGTAHCRSFTKRTPPHILGFSEMIERQIFGPVSNVRR
ncbi:MAG: hypothetical protein R3C16_12790 [Hyphomonadaceae bacterium]